MSRIDVKMHRLVPKNQWRNPVAERVKAAFVETPQGAVEWYRSPARVGGVEAAAERWECWEFMSDSGSLNASLIDAAAPGISLQKRARRGIRGVVNGGQFSIACCSSLRPSRREVQFHLTASDGMFVFKRTGSRCALVRKDPDGREVQIALERKPGQWSVLDMDIDAEAAIVIYIVAEFEYFLESPLLRIL